ncbi:MAG: TonB-dependent receptor, partial [Idiomarinaceae bacterium]|nr:TonB-dependent receptor [Idiomarinaceae bacterium]
AELYDNGNENEGDSLTFKIDGEYFVDKFGFERLNFGARWDKREVSEADRLLTTAYRAPLSEFDPGLTHVNSNFFDGQAEFPDSWAVASGHYIYNNRSEIRNIYGYDNSSDNLVIRKNFEIEETTAALYLQGDYSFQLGGKLVDGQVGLRWEDADRDMDFIPDDGEISSASGGSSTILPTFVVRYHLTDDLLARFAYTETIRRPNFVQLNSNIVYNEDLTNVGYGTANGGNPNLEPVESQNLDVSLEYYFGEGNSLYATWFRRDIEGFVFDSVNVVRRDSPETGEEETYILSQPDNSSNGVLTGWELGAVYFPDYLPDALDGFGVQASATLLDSEQDLPDFGPDGELQGYTQRDMFGVSDTSYSVVAIYEKENFDMRLSYVWRDDFLNNYEAALFANPRGVYRRPEQSVDFQMSYDVNEHLTVTLDGTNLTEETYQSYYQYPYTHNFGNALYSRTFALGVRYTM